MQNRTSVMALVALVLVSSVRVGSVEEPAWLLWGNSEYIKYDSVNRVYWNHNTEIELWRLGDPELTKPERVPLKTRFFLKSRIEYFSSQPNRARLGRKKTRRFVLINVEETLNRVLNENDRQYRVWPHLGLLFVGTAAEEEGYEVVMWDELVKGHAPLDKLVKPGDIVGFSLVVTGMERGIALARQAKALGAQYAIAGNDSAIFRANQILTIPDRPIDVVFTSNSVSAVRRFFREIGEVPLEGLQIPGVQVIPTREEHSNERDRLLVELDARKRQKAEGSFENSDVFVVPNLSLYPHWNEVWANYRATFGHKHSNPHTVRNAMALFAQGCTRTQGSDVCSYCTIAGVADIRVPSREYLRRTAEAYKAFGVDMVFNVTDSVYEMAGVVKMLQEDSINWNAMTIYGRSQGIARNPALIDKWLSIVNDRLLINVGMDSGSDKILQQGIMKSSSKLDESRFGENRRAVELIKAAGPKAHLHCSLIFGSPGETLETCESSIEFLEWTIQTLGSQLDICETDIYWLNFGSPASRIFRDYDEAQKFASLAGKSITRREWEQKFACFAKELVVPEQVERAWYRFFTNIDFDTAQAYNQRAAEIMARHTGSIRGRAFRPA